MLGSHAGPGKGMLVPVGPSESTRPSAGAGPLHSWAHLVLVTRPSLGLCVGPKLNGLAIGLEMDLKVGQKGPNGP